MNPIQGQRMLAARLNSFTSLNGVQLPIASSIGACRALAVWKARPRPDDPAQALPGRDRPPVIGTPSPRGRIGKETIHRNHGFPLHFREHVGIY